MTQPETPNVGADLLRIHHAITRGLSVARQSIQKIPAPMLREGLRRYLQALTGLLHAHHMSEDEIAFPFWQAKDSSAPIQQLSAQHQQIQPLLDRVTAWLADANAWQEAALADLQAALADLENLWHTHIQLEEATLSPARAAELLTSQENLQLGIQLGEHGRQHSQPPELVIPFILYNLPPAERAVMIQNFPPQVTQQLLPGPWKAAWTPMQPFLLNE